MGEIESNRKQVVVSYELGGRSIGKLGQQLSGSNVIGGQQGNQMGNDNSKKLLQRICMFQSDSRWEFGD